LINFIGNNVACCTENGIIQIYDCENFSHLKTLYGHSNKINSIVYNSKRNVLLSSAIDGDIKAWDMLCYQCIMTIRLNYLEGVDCLLILSNGYFAFISMNNKIQIWDLDKYQCINEFKVYKDSATRLEFLKDNRLLCISENQIILWEY
jgi:WD40 repeat protein